MTHLSAPATYTALRDEILQVLQEGKERARRAVEREKVITYKEVGRMLHEHILAHRYAPLRVYRLHVTVCRCYNNMEKYLHDHYGRKDIKGF